MASSFFSDFGLIWYLEELNKKEFKKFKEHFKQETLKLELKQISWTKVKKSSREDLANLLIQQYEAQQAWNLTLRIFHRLGRQDLCDKVQRERTEHKKIYRAYVKNKFSSLYASKSITDFFECFGENVRPEELKYMHLLFAAKETGQRSHTTVLQGAQGVGKTTFLMKLVLGWAEGSLFQDKFLYVFYFCCRELRQVKETSLADLMSRNWPYPSPAPITEIVTHPEKLLFIIDSFEELKCDLSEPESDLCGDWMKQQPVRALLSGLLRKKMLPEASLLVAVTPVCPAELQARLVCPELITLSGFSEGEIELYFRSLFPSRNRAAEAFRSVRENAQIYSLCHAPRICWVIGTCMKQAVEKGRELAPICRCLTSLYASSILNLFTDKDASCPSPQSRVRLRGLCSLAVEGMWTDVFEFHDEDLRRNGIADLDVPALLDTNIFLKCTESSYTFAHRSIQEFCAAMFYLLRRDHPNPAVRSRETLLAAHLKKVKKARWIHWGSFLFGFLNEKEQEKVDKFFGFQPSQEIRQQFHQILKNLEECEGLRGQTDFLALFYCLFEMEDAVFVKEAVNFLQDINFSINNELDLEVCAYCLKYCSGLRRLSFSVPKVIEEDGRGCRSSCNVVHWHHIFCVFITNEHLKELEIINTDFCQSSLEILCNQLRFPTCHLEKLQLNCVSFSGGSSVFFEVLSHSPDLKYLNLRNVNLSCDDMKILCKVLSSSMCNIEQLVLSGCFLRNPSWDLLHAVLSKKSLCSLDLSTSSLYNKGLKVLCAALRHPDCCLQSLGLANCSFTAAGCQDLASVLTSNQKLTSLQIGLNKIGDVGVKVLCDALTHPNCHLEILGLKDCGLTSACCRDLYSALTNSRTLRVLDLTLNTLDHRGVAVLCEALKYTACPLWFLGLPKTRVDEETQMLLTAVEERNPHLTVHRHLVKPRRDHSEFPPFSANSVPYFFLKTIPLPNSASSGQIVEIRSSTAR
ncbi:NACHT, LRR and PYD domains-containing protein 4 [Otolemur garnettii]|uniref:NACHT, LRR and PYD domains-containing protein 4 n=1 Tax=Otolemur garnettii TaxID=30611 RepID=UPI000273FB6F|nr:NACHT, LRR and PYD domains-containing protein 4 [Otolemur garnettii]